MANFWSDKNVVVTGGAGFLGSHLVPRLEAEGATVFVPRSKDYDLRHGCQVRAMFNSLGGVGKVDLLYHLAANVGGIGANQRSPADIIYDNLLMNTHVLQTARQYEVGKIICAGSVCAYPKYVPVPFVEENLFNGPPEDTNAAYGESKRAMLVHLQALRNQYGTNGIYLLLTNLYGPGMEFEPDRSHALAALIRKFTEAQDQGIDTVDVWGSGTPSRDFLYIEDAAEAFVLAAMRYNRPGPLNIGSGTEMRIMGLVEIIKEAVGFKGRAIYDHSRPDGQPRRALNVRAAWDTLGWKAKVDLKEGVKRTVAWWQDQCKA